MLRLGEVKGKVNRHSTKKARSPFNNHRGRGSLQLTALTGTGDSEAATGTIIVGRTTLARCCRCSAKKFKPTISIIGTSCLVRPAQPPMSNLLIERVLTVLAKSSRPRAFPELCSRSTIKSVPEREQALTGVNPEFEKIAISASVGMDRIRARGGNPLVAFFGRPAEDSAGVERSGDLRIVVSLQHQTNSRWGDSVSKGCSLLLSEGWLDLSASNRRVQRRAP